MFIGSGEGVHTAIKRLCWDIADGCTVSVRANEHTSNVHGPERISYCSYIYDVVLFYTMVLGGIVGLDRTLRSAIRP